MINFNNWKVVGYGMIYGLALRSMFSIEDLIFPETDGLMTLSFLFIVPFVIGILMSYHRDSVRELGIKGVMMRSFLAIVGFVAITLILGKEGLICIIMAFPIFLVMAVLGALIGLLVFRKSKNTLTISFFMLLPVLVAPIEGRLGWSHRIFTEHSTIEIQADTPIVWDNITRVREISKDENRVSLFQLMGFPRPIKAELDTIGVGGIRKAIFDKGLFFTETVTEVEKERLLAFTIEADPGSIPPKALDEHVLVGGHYFDILEGRYELEKVSNRKLILHLTSQFRLSTAFNFYSGFWSRLIMRDIQENILEIIKERCEKK